jgi:hypothetical protein
MVSNWTFPADFCTQLDTTTRHKSGRRVGCSTSTWYRGRHGFVIVRLSPSPDSPHAFSSLPRSVGTVDRKCLGASPRGPRRAPRPRREHDRPGELLAQGQRSRRPTRWGRCCRDARNGRARIHRLRPDRDSRASGLASRIHQHGAARAHQLAQLLEERAACLSLNLPLDFGELGREATGENGLGPLLIFGRRHAVPCSTWRSRITRTNRPLPDPALGAADRGARKLHARCRRGARRGRL